MALPVFCQQNHCHLSAVAQLFVEEHLKALPLSSFKHQFRMCKLRTISACKAFALTSHTVVGMVGQPRTASGCRCSLDHLSRQSSFFVCRCEAGQVKHGVTWCREEVQAAEEAAQAQSHKLTAALQEKTELEAQLHTSCHQLAAVEAAADAAGQQKDGELQRLAAQLKVECVCFCCS